MLYSFYREMRLMLNSNHLNSHFILTIFLFRLVRIEHPAPD
jgi:hypothetical protein